MENFVKWFVNFGEKFYDVPSSWIKSSFWGDSVRNSFSSCTSYTLGKSQHIRTKLVGVLLALDIRTRLVMLQPKASAYLLLNCNCGYVYQSRLTLWWSKQWDPIFFPLIVWGTVIISKSVVPMWPNASLVLLHKSRRTNILRCLKFESEILWC